MKYDICWHEPNMTMPCLMQDEFKNDKEALKYASQYKLVFWVRRGTTYIYKNKEEDDKKWFYKAMIEKANEQRRKI